MIKKFSQVIYFTSFIGIITTVNLFLLYVNSKPIIQNNLYVNWILGLSFPNSMNGTGTTLPFVDSGAGFILGSFELGNYKSGYFVIDFVRFLMKFFEVNSSFMTKVIYLLISIIIMIPSFVYLLRNIGKNFILVPLIMLVLFIKQCVLNYLNIGIGFTWPLSDLQNTSFLWEVKSIVGMLFVGDPSIQLFGQDPRNLTLFLTTVSFISFYFRPKTDLFKIMLPAYFIDFYAAAFGHLLLYSIQIYILFHKDKISLNKNFFFRGLFNSLMITILWINLSLWKGGMGVFIILSMYFIFLFIVFQKEFFHSESFCRKNEIYLKNLYFVLLLLFVFFASLTIIFSNLFNTTSLHGIYLVSAFMYEAFPRYLFTAGYFIQSSIIIIVLNKMLSFSKGRNSFDQISDLFNPK